MGVGSAKSECFNLKMPTSITAHPREREKKRFWADGFSFLFFSNKKLNQNFNPTPAYFGGNRCLW